MLSTLPLTDHAKGSLLCVIGVLVLTPDSLLVRLASSDLPGMEIIFFKYLFMFSILTIGILLKDREKFFQQLLSLGYIGWFSAILWGISNFAINYAFLNTNIASVLVINSSNPIFAAIGSYLLLNEIIRFRTVFTIIVCLGALVYIFVSELTGGGEGPGLIGLFSALVASVTLGSYFALLRYVEKVNG
jgi:drug/metabolite transporter (DMT)-like permease